MAQHRPHQSRGLPSHAAAERRAATRLRTGPAVTPYQLTPMTRFRGGARSSFSSTSSVISACCDDEEPGGENEQGGDLGYDYEVVFTEEKLGLTLKCQDEWADDVEEQQPRTVVKSANGVAQIANQIHEGDVLLSVNDVSVVNLEFSDVLCVLKVSTRPIRLRFRTSSPRRWLNASMLAASASDERGRQVAGGARVMLSLNAFLLPEEPQEDGDDANDDADSHYAVQSESFGDADSTRTTEDSSVITDITEIEYKASRHSSSRFTAFFLRKPFRRADGFDHNRVELRMGIIPAAPRLEISADSPSKAAIRVYWRGHPKALSYHVQYSRDRAMRVWKNWSGQVRRSNENELELFTVLFGLDFAKSYIVRLRFEFDSTYSPGEWSMPSRPLLTPEMDAYRAAQARARRG
uniref:PDZ domain-containing protein n=1 Tax=Globisporangium ultimum (strain ATCC 200006 / CBS 805.95 / DAOM BR144) TaxID=431595 RepID=K3X4F1_GLOUD